MGPGREGLESALAAEEIAEAAEVSPTTVYRYFPTKPDLVIYDDLDETMMAALRNAPRGLTAVQAMRHGITAVFGETVAAGAALEIQRERAELLRDVPELRAAMLDELTRSINMISSVIAERAGRPADDDDVVALAGAVTGVTIAAWFASEGDDWITRFLERMDHGMELLETGFSL